MYEKRIIKSAFYNAKKNAKARGIPFLFTFDDWVNWWEDHLGTHWYKKRGSRRGQYVMARFEDKGSYTAKNTKCILSEDNHVEYNKRRKPSSGWSHGVLDEPLVVAIYLSDEPYGIIAKKHGVTKHKIQCIKRKHYYRKITDELDVR